MDSVLPDPTPPLVNEAKKTLLKYFITILLSGIGYAVIFYFNTSNNDHNQNTAITKLTTDVEEIKNERVETKLNTQALENIQTQVTDLKQDIKSVDAKVNNLDSKVNGIAEKMDEKFLLVDQKFDKIDAKFDKMYDLLLKNKH